MGYGGGGAGISISTENAAYAPGKTIVLSLCFRMWERRTCRSRAVSSLAVYKVTVLLPDGKQAPLTLFGQGASRPPGSIGVEGLKPGNEISTRLDLTRLFDFTLPGKYTVVVQRPVSKDRTFVAALNATSNKLELTVDESLAAGKTSPISEARKAVEKTWGAHGEGAGVSISSEKAAYAPGKAIALSVCFRMSRQKDVEVVETNLLGIYHVDVLLPDGKPAPLTLFGRGASRPPLPGASRS